MQIKPKVSIIVLNWNNYEDTKECLESLARISYPNYEVIVVDNGSEDNSTKRIQKELPQHAYIYNDTNLGFTGGNNVGMKYAMKRGADYIFWINNDMVVDKGFLEPLVQAMENERAGLVGPATYYYEQREKIYSAGEDLNFFRTRLKKYKVAGKFRQVDALGGAFLIKKEVIDKIGYFYEPYFLNLEETDYCFQARKAGFKIFCEPKSKIWHKVGTTIRKMLDTATYYYYRNKLLFIKRNAPFYLKFPLYFYWHLYLISRYIEKLVRKDKKMAFVIKNALIDFHKGRFGKKKCLKPDFKHILIIHPGGIGDLIMFVPALKILRENFPQAKIDLFIPFSLPDGDILKQNNLINRILKFSLNKNNFIRKAKFIYGLRKEKYDLSIMPSAINPFKGGILSFLIGAKTRVGERKQGKINAGYTHTCFLDKQKHAIDSNIDLLKTLGLKINYASTLLEFKKDPAFLSENNLKDKILIGFHPGAGRIHRYLLWDKDNFVELGQKILENYKDACLIIFQGPEEKDICAYIKNRIKENVFLAADLSLEDIAALINACDVFVASDSGLGHIASATRANLISIFGPSSAERSAPVGSRVNVIKGKCNHPYDENRIHTCLEKISPDLVFNQVEKILKNEKIN